MAWGNCEKLDAMQKQLDKLTDKVAGIDGKFGLLINGFIAFAKELEKPAAQPAAVKADNQQQALLQAEVNRLNEKINGLETERDEINASLKAEKASHAATLVKIRDLENENAKIRASLEAEKKHLAAALVEIQGLEDEKAKTSMHLKTAHEIHSANLQKIQNLEDAIDQLRTKLEEEQKAKTGLDATLQASEAKIAKLSKEKNALAGELSATELKFKASAAQLEELAKIQLPDQKKLAGVWQTLATLPQAEKEVIAAYYDLSSPGAFLAGAGQFTRLEQLWDASARKIGEGQALPAMGQFIGLLVDIYNQANRDSQARIIQADSGANYDYTTFERIGKNGDTVQKTLLPGLTQPGGKLAKKCLVTLK